MHVFVLYPSSTLKHLEVQSSSCKTTITHNNSRHRRVSFSPFATFLETAVYYPKVGYSDEAVHPEKRP